MAFIVAVVLKLLQILCPADAINFGEVHSIELDKYK